MSEHPLATHAVGEAVGQILDTVGPGADLVVAFVSGHLGSFEEIAGAIRRTLEPGTLLAVGAQSVLEGSIEIEDRPAVAIWAGRTGPVAPVRVEVQRRPDGVAVGGLDEVMAAGAGTLLLLADPFTTPVDGLLGGLAEQRPGLQVVGGLASGANAPGANRLALDDRILTDGAVGALLPPGVVTPLVSQGCRPIGEPYIVTAADGGLVRELAGRPALERLEEIVRELGPDDQGLVANGLHVGFVVDESKTEFERGDFLIRNVVGADREHGTLAVGAETQVGTTLQFHVRDADSADEDLRLQLADTDATPASALVFTCNGRGRHLFGTSDHDARLISGRLGPAVAGMFCAGEIGPVGPRSHLHGFTASLAIFPEDDGRSAPAEGSGEPTDAG